jgi:hypothetical protein
MTGQVPAFRRGMHGVHAIAGGTILRWRNVGRHSGARSSREPGIQRPYAAAGFRVCVRSLSSGRASRGPVGAHPGTTRQKRHPSFRGARSSREPGIQKQCTAAGFRVCAQEGASRNDEPSSCASFKQVATWHRRWPASCCTCAHAMLAKPRFYAAGTSCTGRKSKSRLNSKDLGRLAPHCGDGLPLGV